MLLAFTCMEMMLRDRKWNMKWVFVKSLEFNVENKGWLSFYVFWLLYMLPPANCTSVQLFDEQYYKQ